MRSARDRTDGLALGELQRWFLARVSGDESLEGPERRIEEVLSPSESMSASERLAVYSGMYFARLHESLAEDYPGVRGLLGEAGFEGLARSYFAAHPPTSFTLARAGRGLPAFLEEASEYGGLATAEVARLELALTEAFDAPYTRRLGAGELSALPPELWPEARFRMAAGFQLLESECDVHAVLDAVTKGEPCRTPDAARVHTVIWRRDFQVWRRQISRPMYRTLEVLAAGGRIAEAVEAALDSWEGVESLLAERVFSWFGEWLQEGFFSAVVPPGAEERTGR